MKKCITASQDKQNFNCTRNLQFALVLELCTRLTLKIAPAFSQSESRNLFMRIFRYLSIAFHCNHPADRRTILLSFVIEGVSIWKRNSAPRFGSEKYSGW